MKKKSLLFLVTLTLILGTSSFASNYSDIVPIDPCSVGVQYIDEFDDKHGSSIINGFPDGTFRPYDSLTREQVAKMFVEYIGTDKYNYINFGPGKDFPDVDYTRWSNVHISALSQVELIHGYPDGMFYPDREMTRAEFTKMLNQLVKYISKNNFWYKDIYNYTFVFHDIHNHWAGFDIDTMVTAIDIDCYAETGYFYPDAPITRVEAAYMLSKVIEFNYNLYGYVPVN